MRDEDKNEKEDEKGSSRDKNERDNEKEDKRDDIIRSVR